MRDSDPGFLFPLPQKAVGRGLSPVCCVVIDAEENFDWLRPHEGTPYSTSSLHDVTVLHDILDAYGAAPAYLLTYPALLDDTVVLSLRRQVERDRCVLGVQLHTWVTPPFQGDTSHHLSYSSNLPLDVEERKLLQLKVLFRDRFGFDPVIFRGGRYGFGANTAALLEKHGFTIDVSVAPRTNFSDEGGPNYLGYEFEPFWFGRNRRLLEIPLCRSVVGWSGRAAAAAYHLVSESVRGTLRLNAVLTRTHYAERITLSPEGNDLRAMMRLVRGLSRRGQPILPLSFHSSSLVIGGNPYVRTKPELHRFYDRLSGLLDHLAARGCGFTDILRVADYLEAPSC